MQILTFFINDKAYAIDVALIDSIENIMIITPIPKANKQIMGLISNRGSVIPVINTALLLKEKVVTVDFRKLIITNVGNEKIALAVEDIEDVMNIEENNIEVIDKEKNIIVVKIDSILLQLINKVHLSNIKN